MTLATACIAMLAFVAAPLHAERPPLVDAPVVWWDMDSAHVAKAPVERDPNIVRDQLHESLVRPLRRHASPDDLVKEVRSWFGGSRWGEAQNVNALDEVTNSSWFTNRIGLFPMSPEDAARGPGDGDGPDRSAPWTVIRAKTEGVTPGFNVRDALGDVYVIKFDPQGHPWLTIGPGAICARLFHAAGYNVPDDAVVTFRREELVLGEGVKISVDGIKRDMTEADLESILARVEQASPGEYLAIASKFLAGKPIGPFDYSGRREDDPNDRIRHEHRRELRGLRLLAAWTNHFDTKQHNTRDMFVEEGGRSWVRHHLIDFTATLGAGGRGPSEKYGLEYGVDPPAILGRVMTLGLVEDDWRKLRRPEGIPEIGFFEATHFDPMGFEPLIPNTAFAHMTDRDGYWAAKIITAFTDDHLAALCATGRYANPRAAAYLAEVLAQRRDIIAREFFARVCPIDFFRAEDGRVTASDLGVARGIWSAQGTRYRARTWAVDANRRPAEPVPAWTLPASPEIAWPAGSHPFQAVEFQVSRDGGSWSSSAVAYLARASGRVVEVNR